jgi:AbrB family looped-hinge helix DNA binding protein
MESTRASSKGQMIIPKAIREALQIQTGTELGVELLPDKAFKVTVKPLDPAEQVRRLAGSLSHRAKGLSREAETAAIRKAVLADDERIKRSRRRR